MIFLSLPPEMGLGCRAVAVRHRFLSLPQRQVRPCSGLVLPSGGKGEPLSWTNNLRQKGTPGLGKMSFCLWLLVLFFSCWITEPAFPLCQDGSGTCTCPGVQSGGSSSSKAMYVSITDFWEVARPRDLGLKLREGDESEAVMLLHWVEVYSLKGFEMMLYF